MEEVLLRPLWDIFHILQYEKMMADIDAEEAEIERLKQESRDRIRKHG